MLSKVDAKTPILLWVHCHRVVLHQKGYSRRRHIRMDPLLFKMEQSEKNPNLAKKKLKFDDAKFLKYWNMCFPQKCMEKSVKTLSFHFWKMFHFGSSSLLKPLSWYSSPILCVIQMLLGIFWDSEFLAHFWCWEGWKLTNWKNVIYLNFAAPKMGKKIKISKNPK